MMNSGDKFSRWNHPAFRLYLLVFIAMMAGLVFVGIPYVYKYFQISNEDGWFMTRFICWTYVGFWAFTLLAEPFARFVRKRLVEAMHEKGFHEVEDLGAGYIVLGTQEQANIYLGRNVLAYNLHNYIAYVFGKDGLILKFGDIMGSVKELVISYDDIDGVRFVSCIDMPRFAGKISGIEINLLGLECGTCKKNDSRSSGYKYDWNFIDCGAHRLVFGLVRRGTYWHMRMSQEESYRRFEEFRDRVMEMKRLPSAP